LKLGKTLHDVYINYFVKYEQIAVTSANSFRQLRDIVQNANAGISFWGVRYIDAIGYEGRCSIDTLAGHVVNLIQKKGKFCEEERIAGAAVKKSIDDFYSQTDIQINDKNPLTRLFFTICEIWICHIHNAGYGPRFTWRSDILFEEKLEKRFKMSTSS
jgi:hypothetical protein